MGNHLWTDLDIAICLSLCTYLILTLTEPDLHISSNIKKGMKVTIIDENNNERIGTISKIITVVEYHVHGVKVEINAEHTGRIKFIHTISESDILNEQRKIFDENFLLSESETLEFKGSMFCNLKKYKKTGEVITEEKNIHSILKTLAAFANKKGGSLYIGVEDNPRKIFGLSNDYELSNDGSGGMKYVADDDKFVQTLLNKIKSNLSNEFNNCISYVGILKLPEGEICIIHVKPSKIPILLNNDGKTEMYVRQGNTSNPYDTIQAFCVYWCNHLDTLNDT